jgi:hypothetical protein
MMTRFGPALLILALMLAYVAMSPWSMVHVDLARDMRVALEIREGSQLPLLGPVLAGHAHLGPIWYYLLAALQSMSGGWLGTVIGLAMLASLQFPLAYLAGNAWAGRTAGLLWAILLLLPAWSGFEQVYPTHTQLVGASVAAMLWCSAHYLRDGRPGWLAGVMLAFSLALHAHVSTIALVGVPMAMAVLAVRRGASGRAALVWALILAALPFMPWLLDQWMHGARLGAELRGYLSSDNYDQVGLGKLPALIWQIAGGGTRYWLHVMLGVPSAWAWGAVLLLAALEVLGLWLLWRRGAGVERAALLIWLVSLPVLVVLRDHFYFWMLTGERVMLLGLVAAGLSRLKMAVSVARLAFAGLALPVLVAYLAVAMSVARWQANGTWPFSILPDVTGDWPATRPLAAMPAQAMRDSGRWLCGAAAVSVHGAYAVALIHGYAMETALACRAAEVVVGGDAPGHSHWLGMSRALAASLGLPTRPRIGPYARVPVKRVLGMPEGLSLRYPGLAPFPPLVEDGRSASTRTFHATLAAGERLALSHLGIGFVTPPNVRIWAGDRELAPLVGDMTVSVYGVEGNGAVDLRIEIEATRPGLVDLVVF